MLVLPCRERENADSFVIEQPCSCQYPLFSNQLLWGLMPWHGTGKLSRPSPPCCLNGSLTASPCGLWGDVSLNFCCFLSSALASKLCLKPAELNLPRLTTVYAGFSYITAVAAFHIMLIQTRCSEETTKKQASIWCATWVTGLYAFKFFLNTVTIIPLF